MPRVTILGLGEAGLLFAKGFRDAGFAVDGFDPFVSTAEPGIRQHDSIQDAVEKADAVFSFVGARAALEVARQAIPAMKAAAVFVDCNTGAPDAKRELAALTDGSAAVFADVAVLAPVPRSGVATPLLASGSGAQTLAEVVADTPADVTVLDGPAGAAAERKLLRSVFMKGLAAVVIEGLEAARLAGHEDWLLQQMADELSGDGVALVERLEAGSKQHAVRRAHETADARDYLASIGAHAWSTEAAHAWLTELSEHNTKGITHD